VLFKRISYGPDTYKLFGFGVQGSNEVRTAVNEALSGGSIEKQVSQNHSGIGYRTRSETRKLLGIAYSTMHYWEKAGILVPHRIGRKVFFSDDAIREALSKAGKEVKNDLG